MSSTFSAESPEVSRPGIGVELVTSQQTPAPMSEDGGHTYPGVEVAETGVLTLDGRHLVPGRQKQVPVRRHHVEHADKLVTVRCA